MSTRIVKSVSVGLGLAFAAVVGVFAVWKAQPDDASCKSKNGPEACPIVIQQAKNDLKCVTSTGTLKFKGGTLAADKIPSDIKAKIWPIGTFVGSEPLFEVVFTTTHGIEGSKTVSECKE